jgi:hypothetical protein
MKDVLVVCPQPRDMQAIAAARLDERYRIGYVGRDLDELTEFDPEAFLRECDALPADGVIGTKDRSALLAALVARRKGLPGPTPRAVATCQFKPTARAIELAAAPDATPRFTLLDGRPPFEPPFFVKPVVGRLSQHARRIDALSQLAELDDFDPYMEGYARIAELAGLHRHCVRGYIAEELLEGDEVTLEGFVRDGLVTVIGITDSVKYPGTNSFERFEFPSALAPQRVAELEAIASRVIGLLGFDGGFFNVEFFVPEAGPAQITEVNGRIASQFWRLVDAVHGRSTYEALFALACGEDPQWEPGPARGVALSYCLRVFEDALVRAVPDPADDLELLVSPGLRLSEQGANDEQSYRLCIFYERGETRAQAVAAARKRAAGLPFELGPVEAPAGRTGSPGHVPGSDPLIRP